MPDKIFQPDSSPNISSWHFFFCFLRPGILSFYSMGFYSFSSSPLFSFIFSLSTFKTHSCSLFSLSLSHLPLSPPLSLSLSLSLSPCLSFKSVSVYLYNVQSKGYWTSWISTYIFFLNLKSFFEFFLSEDCPHLYLQHFGCWVLWSALSLNLRIYLEFQKNVSSIWH